MLLGNADIPQVCLPFLFSYHYFLCLFLKETPMFDSCRFCILAYSQSLLPISIYNFLLIGISLWLLFLVRNMKDELMVGIHFAIFVYQLFGIFISIKSIL